MQDRLANLVVDEVSCVNAVSTYLVEKLNFPLLEHASPDIHYSSNDCIEIKVTKQVWMSISIRSYNDDVLCDVASMQVRHLLFGSPWLYD